MNENKIDINPTMKKKILLLAQHDATVAAYMALLKQSDMKYVDVLEMLIINLQAEKNCYFNQSVKLLQNNPCLEHAVKLVNGKISYINNDSKELLCNLDTCKNRNIKCTVCSRAGVQLNDYYKE